LITGPKIIFVAPSAYPLGGVATWLDYLLPGLRDRGWDAGLALVDGKFHMAHEYLQHHYEPRALRIRCTTGTQEGRIRELCRVIEKARPAIVVSVNIADTAAAVNRLRRKSTVGMHIVHAVHGIEPTITESIKIDRAIIDGVICTNRLACELVARCASLESDEIYYASCGVSVSKTRRGRRKKEKKLRIAFVGRLDRREKKIGDLLAISTELDRRRICHELLVVGEGPDEEWMRTQVQLAPKQHRIRLLGRMNYDDLPNQIYDKIDALLITSPRETGPLVAWEAMSKGVVVVTSAYIGSGLEGSLIHKENCLMFPIGDIGAAADCLETIQDPNVYYRLSQGGDALVTHRYSKSASIDMWSAALNKVMSRPARIAVPEDTLSPTAGRLDKLLGRAAGETVRAGLRMRYDHRDPGGEWPHAKYRGEINENSFLKLARSLDQSIYSKS
jgi:glycosyltransferase involved in cell wall biosynthesis